MNTGKRVFSLVASLWLVGTISLAEPGSVGRVTAAAVAAANLATGDELWDRSFAYPGVDHIVECITLDGQNAYFGGWFGEAGSSFGRGGGVVAGGIARWNGRSWSSLGGGVAGRVYSVAVKGNDVYVGGLFNSAGGVAARNIARWDGAKWWPLGEGADWVVSSLVVIGSSVYAGGDFHAAGGKTVNYVAAWNGTDWSTLGSGVDSNVYAMAAMGNDLIVGGRFTSASGVSANRIARWNGTSWSAVGSGMSGDTFVSVNSLAVTGTTIYAGGSFTTAGEVTVNHIARWDGGAWHALGAGMTGDSFTSDGFVQSIAILGSRVYAGGVFLTAGGVAVKGLAAWDGSTWTPLGSGVVWGEGGGGSVRALAVGGSDLYVGGDFYGAGELAVTRVARWDGEAWHPLGMGIEGEVFAVSSIDGNVFIGGSFTTAGGLSCPRIVVWDGEKMTAVGNGIEGDGTDTAVHAIAKYRGAIVVAGAFATAGGVTVNNIAAWDGTSWSSLGGGVTGTMAQVNALAVLNDILYVGGQFTSAGGVTTGGLARWNGSSWSAVSTGIAGATIRSASAIAVDGARMAVAGSLSMSGGGGSGVALLNGSSWSILGTTDRWSVSSLCFHAGALYAGGGFNTLGGVTSKGIARYDGSGWSALGSGIEGRFPTVSAIAFRGDDLLVAGYFDKIGGVVAANIGRFDGSSWHALGSGIGGGTGGTAVDVLATTADGVMAGGSFAVAGAGPSYGVALWNPDLGSISDVHTWLQVASHASGANQSQWRTDLGLLNPGTVAASAQLVLHASSGAVTRTQSVQPGQQLILTDVVGSFAGASGSAALEVVSDQPLKVSSRTYNLVANGATCYPRGTFGQNYDAVASGQGLATGTSAWLPQLAENTAYRTNIALTNTGTAAAKVTVTLFDGAGGQIGSYGVDLDAGQYKQEARPFSTKAGQTAMARGYAKVTVTLGSGVIASASVVDNLTNDPTTIGMLPTATAGAAVAWVQVGSHATGANESQWRTDLGVLNPGTEQASVQVRFHKSGGVKSNTVAVAAGQQAILVDVVNQIPETGSAGLEIVADRPVDVSSRTYNQVGAVAACYPNGTFGQSYEAFTPARALGQGAVAYLPQLVENTAYRTNIALTNTGSVAASVVVTLYEGGGTQVGAYAVDLGPGEYKQESRPFNSKAGQASLSAGYAKVTVTQGSGIIASASVVDNLTNDPTTILAI
jgi:trimeric autotransporter adhesin